MLAVFNAGLAPVIPAQGSVGASGDLAPLAHMALPLLGRGQLIDTADGRRSSPARRRACAKRGRRADRAGSAKEGLALINGTQIMTAIGGLVVARPRDAAVREGSRRRVRDDDRGAAGIRAAVDSRPCTTIRPHPMASAATADNLRALLAESARSCRATRTARRSRTRTRCAARRRCTARSAKAATSLRASTWC